MPSFEKNPVSHSLHLSPVYPSLHWQVPFLAPQIVSSRVPTGLQLQAEILIFIDFAR